MTAARKSRAFGVPPFRRRQLAAIHAAKRELGLDDDAYRDLLERLTGARSAADVGTNGLNAVLDEFRRLGWKSGRKPAPAQAGDQARLAAHRAAGAGPQEALILSLWDELADSGALRSGDKAGLATFMARVTGRTVDHPRFLAPAEARKVIEGLRAWLARERRRSTP